MTGASPLRAGRALRIDPDALPARYHVSVESGAPDASVYLDSRGVVVKRRLSGLPLTLSLPLTAYDGVAVRLTAGAAGILSASIELAHRDPALTVPLAAGRTIEDAADDWRRWSAMLRLPMLLAEPDGRLLRLDAVGFTPCAPHPRRRNSALTARRPRFLVRRRVGGKGVMPVLAGWREIIARD